MSYCIGIIGIFLSFIGYIFYSIYTNLDYQIKFTANPTIIQTPEVQKAHKNKIVNDGLCSYHEVNMQGGPEDLTKISETIAITGSDQRKLLWDGLNGPSKVPNGKLYSINLPTNQVYQVNIKNFPAGSKFHPHGVYYNHDDQILSVVNHGYDGQNSRVDEFLLELQAQSAKDINAVYQRSLFVDANLNGIINDLVKISENEYLITKFLISPDPLEGRHKLEEWKKVSELFLKTVFKVQKTQVYSCIYAGDDKKSQNLDCLPIDNTFGTVINGITWDYKDQVLVVDTTNKWIDVYKLDQNQKRQNKLVFQERIHTTSHTDNIEYDIYQKQFIAGGFGKTHEHMSYCGQMDYRGSFWAFVDIITRQQEQKIGEQYKCENVFLRNNAIQGCSSALTFQDKLFLGSWTDKTLVTCDLGKL